MKHVCHTTCTHKCAYDKVMKWLFCSDASFWKSLLIWSPTMTVENTAQLSEAFRNNQRRRLPLGVSLQKKRHLLMRLEKVSLKKQYGPASRQWLASVSPGRQHSASAVVNEKGHFLPRHGFANFFFPKVLMVNLKLGTK